LVFFVRFATHAGTSRVPHCWPNVNKKTEGGAPMNKPAEYRENAALCLEAMRAAEVPEVRESLHTLAQCWIALPTARNATAAATGAIADGAMNRWRATHGNDSDRRG
jgi:hypothetical protein